MTPSPAGLTIAHEVTGYKSFEHEIAYWQILVQGQLIYLTSLPSPKRQIIDLWQLVLLDLAGAGADKGYLLWVNDIRKAAMATTPYMKQEVDPDTDDLMASFTTVVATVFNTQVPRGQVDLLVLAAAREQTRTHRLYYYSVDEAVTGVLRKWEDLNKEPS